MRLKDKVAIVTGSGRGIGEGIALRFVEEGAKLVINDVNPADANGVIDKIKALGGKAVAVIGSVASREVVQSMVDVAVKEFGTLDIIVNNAGITRDVMLHKMKDEQWDSVIDVNLKGVFEGFSVLPRSCAKRNTVRSLTSHPQVRMAMRDRLITRLQRPASSV